MLIAIKFFFKPKQKKNYTYIYFLINYLINTLVINKKKYVVVERSEYDKLLEKAASKRPIARKLSLVEGKKLAYKLIDNWHKEK